MDASPTSATLSVMGILLIIWSLIVAGVILFVVYVVFFLDNIKGKSTRMSTKKVLHILQSSLLPVTSANNWHLSSFAHGVPIWRRLLSKEAFNSSSTPYSSSSPSSIPSPDDELGIDLSLCASYTLCDASPSAVWEAVKSLSKNLEWDPYLEYLQRYPQPDPKSDGGISHPSIGRDHVIEGSSQPPSRSLNIFNRLSSRLLGASVFKQLSVLERWWWRPEQNDHHLFDHSSFSDTEGQAPTCWLLSNDTQRLTWTFYCIQPLDRDSAGRTSTLDDDDDNIRPRMRARSSSWVTAIMCSERRLARMSEELVSTRLASLTAFASLSAAVSSVASSLVSGPGSAGVADGQFGVTLYSDRRSVDGAKRNGEKTDKFPSTGDIFLAGIPDSKPPNHHRDRSATMPTHLTRRSAFTSSHSKATLFGESSTHSTSTRGAGRQQQQKQQHQKRRGSHDERKWGSHGASPRDFSSVWKRDGEAVRSLPSKLTTTQKIDEDEKAALTASTADSSSCSDEYPTAFSPLRITQAPSSSALDADASSGGKDCSVPTSKSSSGPIGPSFPVDAADIFAGDFEGIPADMCKSSVATSTPMPGGNDVDEVGYHVVDNQAAADLLAEVLRVSAIDLSTSVSRQKADTGGWSFTGIEKDVVILRKDHKENHLVSLLGKGIISAEPEVVCNTLKNPHSRFMYDEQLKKLNVLHEFPSSSSSSSGSSELKVLHMFHEVTHMLRRYSREICAIQGYRRDGENHVISLRSVIWPTCPEDERQEKGAEKPRRITLLPSGWVVEPITRVIETERDSNGVVEETIGVASMVSYLIQVDLGTVKGEKMMDGWIDLVKKQPLGIAHLRQYLVPAQASDME